MKKQDFKEYRKMEKGLKEFGNQMLEGYDKTTFLKDICYLQNFNNEKEEFMQVARRIILPKELFIKEEGIHKENSAISSDFVRAVVLGERNFIINSIIQDKKSIKEEVDNFGYKELINAISKVQNPTHIFIPIRPFYMNFHSWIYKDNMIKFPTGKGTVLVVGNKEIKVDWLPSDTGIDKIIVLNKDMIKIIQKKFEEVELKGIKLIPLFKEISRGRRLMLYFGDKDKDNFDFVFRTVISKPKLMDCSAIVINVKNKPEE